MDRHLPSGTEGRPHLPIFRGSLSQHERFNRFDHQEIMPARGGDRTVMALPGADGPTWRPKSPFEPVH